MWRLRAYQHLGLDTIEVRRWAVLDPDEQREIELAENLDRKDLTTIERSRNVVALTEVAAEVDRAELRPDSGRNSGRGRPAEPGSLRRVAERTIAFRIPEGVDQMELLEHGFAIDGRDAIFTVTWVANDYGGGFYDAPFGIEGTTLSAALNAAQRDLVKYLREHGCEPKFA